jgi:dTDP-4-dehydrorhamnose reductase
VVRVRPPDSTSHFRPDSRRSAAFGARARRPSNSVLVGGRLATVGLAPLRPWPDALADYLAATGRLRP